MQLCAVAHGTLKVGLNVKFTFKASLNFDAVKLRKYDYGLIKNNNNINGAGSKINRILESQQRPNNKTHSKATGN
jgi:hypothetical protein